MKILLPIFLAGMVGCAHEKGADRTQEAAPAISATIPTAIDPTTVTAAHLDQIRTDCIQGRRLICGRVLKIFPDGLVIESGYTDLLRPPLIQSWAIPGTVSANHQPAVLELKEPGTPCIGLVFLTDIPKRPKAKKFDYVVIMGYPAGPYDYAPTQHIKKRIRRFSAGLDTAVRLIQQVEENSSQGNDPHA